VRRPRAVRSPGRRPPVPTTITITEGGSGPRSKCRSAKGGTQRETVTIWAAHRNLDLKPLVWKAAAEDIILKVQRGRATFHQISTQTEYQPRKVPRSSCPCREVAVPWFPAGSGLDSPPGVYCGRQRQSRLGRRY